MTLNTTNRDIDKLIRTAIDRGINNTKTLKMLENAKKSVMEVSELEADGRRIVIPQEIADKLGITEALKNNPDMTVRDAIDSEAGIKMFENFEDVKVGDAISEPADGDDPFARDGLSVESGIVENDVGNKQNETSGNDIRFDIMSTPDGKKFVQATRQVIKGDNPKKWAYDIQKYINDEIRGGRDVTFTGIDGDVLTITEDTAGKARFRQYIDEKGNHRRLMTDDEYKVKLNAEAHIDEFSQVSKAYNRNLTPDKKNHHFAKDGFNYRIAFFKDFDGQYYKLRITVGHNGDIKTVYNVGKLKPEADPMGSSKAQQRNAVMVTASDKQSLSQNERVFNGNTAQKITRLERNAISALGRLTGTNIEYVSELKDSFGDDANGAIDFTNGVIKLNINGEDPLFVIALHESLHYFARNDAKTFNKVYTEIKNALGSDSELLMKVFKNTAAAYKNHIKGMDLQGRKAYIDEEITAKTVSYLLNNPDVMKNLAKRNRNVAQRLYDSIVYLFEKITGRYEGLYNIITDDSIRSVIEKLSVNRNKFEKMYSDFDTTDGVHYNNYFNDMSYNISYSFAKQIDRILVEKNFPINEAVYVGKFPKSRYSKLGIDINKPILMMQGHVRDINTPKFDNKNETRFHGLSIDTIKHIPAILKNPVMIFDSISKYNYENSICVLSDELDDDGNPIMISLSINDSYIDVKVSDDIDLSNGYHRVTSQYGKDDFFDYLGNIILFDNVLFTDKAKIHKLFDKIEAYNLKKSEKNKTQKSNSDVKLQLLHRLDELGFDKIIHESRNIVNGKKSQKKLINSYNLSNVNSRSESENVGVLGNVSENGIQMDAATSRMLEGARVRYGIGEATIDEETGEIVGYDNSTAQADIDRRLGREFRFEDNTSRSRVSDLYDSIVYFFEKVTGRYEGLYSQVSDEGIRDIVGNLVDKQSLFVDLYADLQDKGNLKTHLGSMFSLSRFEEMSISKQLSENIDILNEMDIVASIDVPFNSDYKSKSSLKKLFDDMNKRGKIVDRFGFGIIEIDFAEINESINYINKFEEYCCFYAIHKVLKRGKLISGHDNHKSEGFPTYTFAAPIEINGKKGYLGVVVKRTKGNRYKCHRIISPDGSRYILEKKESIPTTARPLHQNDAGRVRAIRTDSEYSLSHKDVNYNMNNSQNNSRDLYNLSGSSSLPKGENVETSGNISETGTQMDAATSRMLEGARARYGIGEATIDDETEEIVGYDNSTAQADIDRRLGREFRFEDNTSRSRVSDLYGNSLHLSDSVIFEVLPETGNVADIFRDRGAESKVIGTGRILDIDDAGNVTVTVDSGAIGNNVITVSGDSLIFAAHNNAGTVGKDFNSANPLYGKMKSAFDDFARTGNPEALRSVQFNEMQYALMAASLKMNSMRFRLGDGDMRDHGVQPFKLDEAGRQLYDKAVDRFNEFKENKNHGITKTPSLLRECFL